MSWCYLSQSLSVGAHVSQDDQDVFLTLVGQVLCCGQRQARGDDTLDADWSQTEKNVTCDLRSDSSSLLFAANSKTLVIVFYECETSNHKFCVFKKKSFRMKSAKS